MNLDEISKRIQEQLETQNKQKAEAFVASLPAAVQSRVRVLQSYQDDIKSLRSKFEEEMRALEAKYNTMYAPIYVKRAEITSGAREPSDTELTQGKAAPLGTDAKTVKGVPEFWLTAFKNNPNVAETIQERDEEALKYLRDVTYDDFENPPVEGFTLHFHFDTNPFFENEVLDKTYTLVDEGGQLMLDSAQGTEIKWKPDQDLTVNKIKKKQRHKGGKGTRTVIKLEPCDSFFNFFKPPQGPQEDEEDEEANEALEELLDADLEIGQTIKEDIVPDVVDWFTGAIQPPFNFMMGDEDEDGEFEDDEDQDDEEEEEEPPRRGGAAKKGGAKGGKGGRQQQQDDDDDDDDEDDAPAPPKKGGAKKGGAAADPKADPECKQQ